VSALDDWRDGIYGPAARLPNRSDSAFP